MRWRLRASRLASALVVAFGCQTGEPGASPGEGAALAPDAGGTTSGADGGAGPSAPASCGDGKRGPGEACDDANRADGDGCSSTCAIESAGPNDVCRGAPVALAQVGTGTRYRARVTGTTSGLYDHYAASCGGGSGPDAVYVIDAPRSGRATVRATAGFSAIVSARTACDDHETELTCGDVALGGGGDGGAPHSSEIAFPVFAGKPTFLLVDGYGGASGEFALDIEVQTAVCGNGQAESPEECDDGNTASGDGCSASCAMEDTATPSTCPGMGIRLGATAAAEGKVSFAGDTSALANGGGSATGCGDTGAGPNAIYALTPAVGGSLSLRLVADYDGALLHVRRECSESASVADCQGATAARTPLQVDVPVTAEQTVSVFVDGASGSSGLYVLDATLTVAACGNGKLDGGEECDDGNVAAGDGCSATCAVERDPTSYACPGQGVRLEAAAAGPRTAKLRGTTAPLVGETVPASKWSSCGSGAAPDVVYRVSSDIDGWLTARVRGAFNATVQLRASCPGTSDVACARAATGNGQETLVGAVDKEQDYFLVVDGASAGASGGFELELTVDPSVCGNGVTEGGETCDDGGVAGGDGCDATCELETDLARDECTTAPLVTLDAKADGSFAATVNSGTTNLTKPASPTHTMAPCSSNGPDGFYPFVAPISGVVTARVTSATFRTTLGVRSGCGASGALLTCDDANAKGGQEIVFAVEQGETYVLSVAGGYVSGTTQLGRFTMDVSLVPAGCGDTFVSGVEACDDGNRVGGDGCSATCTLESAPALASCPGKVVALAGAGGEVRRAVVTVDTTPLPSRTGSVCGGSGPEGIVAVTSDTDGQLVVKASAAHAVVVYARRTCDDPLTEVPRASCSGASVTSVTAAVTKAVPLYVFVDGLDGASGVAELQITVTP